MFAVLRQKVSPPVLLLDTDNSSKGGDFMERIGKTPREAISPDQGRVLDESDPPTHPLVNGKRKTALEIATTYLEGQPVIDRVVFLSVSRMDAGE